MNVLVGAGVGGGSLVYNAALIAPTESLFYTIFDDTELYSTALVSLSLSLV